METDQQQSTVLETMCQREAEMMRLLGSKSPDRLVHDLRNILNELTLLKAVAEMD